MRLRELKSGTWISDKIRVDSPLDSHNGIATYLASDSDTGHALLHVFPDFDETSLEKLEKVCEFQREICKLETRAGRYEEFLYFSEPFPLGEFLFEWLERRERVALPEAIKRIIKLLHIMQHAHEQGIYHGRITPKSILLERTSETFDLRVMGLGISQCLAESMRLDIDWFDYTFDLEGMTPESVDIYGIAIILMGLVSGEQGIDSFEATGLLPNVFRGGIMQQAMERALALRIDAYTDVLSFSLDLEAALLELDAKEGEVYVGDLVGFESAIKSIASISEEHQALQETSGEWSSLVGTLEQNERSSLLCSLTSLTSIKAVEDDDDDDVTCITSVPKSVLSQRRIRAAHAAADNDETTSVTPFKSSAENDGARTPSQQKLAEIQSIESRIGTDDDDEEDDAPTRVIKRPNYYSIRFDTKQAGVTSSIEDVIASSTVPMPAPLADMIARINKAEVKQRTQELGHDVIYDIAEEEETLPASDPVEPPNPEPAPESKQREPEKTAIIPQPVKQSFAKTAMKIVSKKQQRFIILLLIGIIILLLILIILRSA